MNVMSRNDIPELEVDLVKENTIKDILCKTTENLDNIEAIVDLISSFIFGDTPTNNDDIKITDMYKNILSNMVRSDRIIGKLNVLSARLGSEDFLAK